jgi:cell division protein FtsA
MFEDTNIVVGLEIGTSKICAVVGEQNVEGTVNIIGLGQSLSSGVRKGEISDTEKVEQEVRAAVFEAEQMADVEIRSVYLGVTGGHIRGFSNRRPGNFR